MMSPMFVTALTLLMSGPPGATDPAMDEAELLHKKAKTHYEQGRFHDAVELWLLAEARRPNARYEVNLAKSYLALSHPGSRRDDLIECFRWTEHLRPRVHELPDEPIETWVSLATCGNKLKEKRALFSLHVEGLPQGASILITLNGRPWMPPWHTSPPDTVSHVRVVMGDLVWFDGQVDHPVGKHTTKRVLAPARPEPISPAPSVAINAAEATVEPPATLAPWRWATLGSGLLLSAVGAGLVGHAYALQSELEDVNARYAAGALDDATYLSEYGDAERSQAIAYPTGVTVLSLGAASLVTAIVLFAIDDGAPASATVTPAWLGLDTPIGVIGRF